LPDGASYIDVGLLPGTYYYTVAAVDSSGNEGEWSEPVVVDISETGIPGGGTLAAPKGKLTLTGFSQYDGYYVLPTAVIGGMPTSEEEAENAVSLVGLTGAEWSESAAFMSLARINGGAAEIPLYRTTNEEPASLDDFIPYEGNDALGVLVFIVTDDDGKITPDEGELNNTVATIMSNFDFTPHASNGNITISISDVDAGNYILLGNHGGSERLPAPSLGLSSWETTVYLSWTPVEGAVSYNIYRDYVSIERVSDSYYTDVGLAPGFFYSYQVAAVDSNGNEGELSEASILVTVTESETPALPVPAR
jgi:chitodextrinase